MTVVDEAESETDLALLTQTEDEKGPWKLRHGTRESLRRGHNRVKAEVTAIAWEPVGAFTALSGASVACAGSFSNLGPNECVLMIDSTHYYCGPNAVWRYPVMSPTDIQVWNAVKPPSECTELFLAYSLTC